MARLDAVLPALTQGRSVRRDEWEPFVRMFVLDDTLMCQIGNASPWHHSLTWGELIASDWRLIRTEADDKEEEHASLLTSKAPGVLEGALLSSFNGMGPRYGRVISGLVTKWWNAD
jgi:hypothetical protein